MGMVIGDGATWSCRNLQQAITHQLDIGGCMKTISVIASPCNDEGRIHGDRLCDAMFKAENVAAASELANSLRKKGVSVILRPNYNDENGRSFREYRSFNGEDFREVVFNI
jgi:hypothetical protein